MKEEQDTPTIVLNDKYSLTNGWDGNPEGVPSTEDKIRIEEENERQRKEEFYEKYNTQIKAEKQPMIYDDNEHDEENKIKSYLKFDDIQKYIQRNDLCNDVKGIKIRYDTVPDYMKDLKKNKKLISKIIDKAKKIKSKPNQLGLKNMTRKAYIAKCFIKQETQPEQSHTSCACIFYDKKKNKTTIIAPYNDEGYKEYFIKNKPENITYKLIDLQKDHKSCGIVAIEMIKHLTPKWFEEHKGEIEKLESDEIPDAMLPKKLLAYKQGGLYEIYKNHRNVFDKLMNKGYLKKTYTEDDLKTDPELKRLKVQNKHLQVKKTKIKYYNAYKHRKRNIKAEKHSSEYYEEKNEIINGLEERFKKQQPDSEFSGNEEEIKTENKINLNNQNQINEIK